MHHVNPTFAEVLNSLAKGICSSALAIPSPEPAPEQRQLRSAGGNHRGGPKGTLQVQATNLRRVAMLPCHSAVPLVISTFSPSAMTVSNILHSLQIPHLSCPTPSLLPRVRGRHQVEGFNVPYQTCLVQLTSNRALAVIIEEVASCMRSAFPPRFWFHPLPWSQEPPLLSIILPLLYLSLPLLYKVFSIGI